jgi:hypothetical protein
MPKPARRAHRAFTVKPLRPTAWGGLHYERQRWEFSVPEDVDRTARGGQQAGAVRVWRALAALDRPSLHLYKQRPKYRMYVRLLARPPARTHAEASRCAHRQDREGLRSCGRSASVAMTPMRGARPKDGRRRSPQECSRLCATHCRTYVKRISERRRSTCPSMPKRPGASYVVPKRVHVWAGSRRPAGQHRRR